MLKATIVTRYRWTAYVNDTPCLVELDHNYWTTRQVVRVNNVAVVDHTPLHNLEYHHPFSHDGSEFLLIIGWQYLPFTRTYTLLVDGRAVVEE